MNILSSLKKSLSLATSSVNRNRLHFKNYSFQQRSLFAIQRYKFTSQDEGFIAIATHFVLQKDYERAEYYLREAEKTQSQNSQLYSLLGSVLFAKKDYANANTYMKKSLELKEDPSTQLNLGISCYYQKSYSESEKILESLLKNDNIDSIIYFYLGMVKFSKGEFIKGKEFIKKYEKDDETTAKQALERYKNQIQKEEDDLLNGNKKNNTSSDEKPKQILDEDEDKDTDDQIRETQHICELVQQNRLREAVDASNQMLKKNPNSFLGNYCLASAIAKSGDYKQAQTIIEKVLRKKSRIIPEEHALIFTIEMCLKGNNAVDAQKYVDQLNVQFPQCIQRYYLEGFLRDIQGRLSEAEKLLKQIPDNSLYKSEGYLKLGEIYFKQGRFQESLRVWEQGIQLNPQGYLFYHNMGCVYRTIGDLNKAIDSFNQALSIYPDYYHTHVQLVFIYRQLGDKKKEGESFKIVIEYNPLRKE